MTNDLQKTENFQNNVTECPKLNEKLLFVKQSLFRFHALSVEMPIHTLHLCVCGNL